MTTSASPLDQADELDEITRESRARAVPWQRVYKFPWWALLLGVIFVWVAIAISRDEIYSNIFNQLQEGIALTLRVAFLSYGLALIVGLVVGVIRSQPPKHQRGFWGGVRSLLRLAIYNLATFFVEVMRGLPIIIVLLIFAFVLAPAYKDWVELNYGFRPEFRGSSETVAIVALALLYGAYLSEVFRAGIQSIERGQVEAARSLGMNYLQVMRFVVLPQAIRRIIPPLGNNMVSMIKDTSLVAFLGIRDITQIAKVSSGSSFRYEETYFVVAVLYLSLTITGSLIVRVVERYLRTTEH